MDTIKKLAPILIIILVVFGVLFSKSKKIEAPTNSEIIKEQKNDIDSKMGEYIIISSPVSYETIKSPLKINGKARGNWFFEGSAPVEITDEEGNIINKKYITAEGEWMTTNFVPFSGEMSFTVPEGTKSGYIVFIKDNPSGDAKFDMSFRLPVRFE